MLEDHKRTGAYHQAILNNRACFEGKVVLDVGTGSGILAIFAAQAGARKVYAVEATSMARVAKELVEHNNVRTQPGSLHGHAVVRHLECLCELVTRYLPPHVRTCP
jgi:ribosomal protein L11 methylase PrmA